MKKYWLLIVALLVLWASIIVPVVNIWQTQGQFTYILDDAYIHMAVAKHFVQHGVWGVTKYCFSSSTSSLLWPLLISASYAIFGVNEISPLILNIIFATGLICLVYFILQQYKISDLLNFLVLVALIFLVQAPILVLSGMEHVLQILVNIAFVYIATKALVSEDSKLSKTKIGLMLLAVIVTMTRYEGLFLLFIICLLFCIRKRFSDALLLGVAGLFPLVIYGFISLYHGWHFLPNPVLLKGSSPQLDPVGIGKSLFKLADNPRLFLIVGIILFLLKINKKEMIWEDSPLMSIIFIPTILFHAQFSMGYPVPVFKRYEAYLMGMGMLIITISLHDCLRLKFSYTLNRVFNFFAAIASIVIILYGYNSIKIIPLASQNIYEQQYQMGLFLKKFYPGQTVAANDIGAINYLTDIDNVDLYGFGNLQVADMIKDKSYNAEKIYNVTKARKTKIAIIYDNWFEDTGIPYQWVRVGRWKILDNIICGGDVVSFYATDPGETDNLIKNLQAFSATLPQTVLQIGKYTKNSNQGAGGRKNKSGVPKRIYRSFLSPEA